MILYNVWVIFPTRSISWEYWSHVVSHNSWCIFLVKEQDQVGNLWSIWLIHASSMHGDPPHGPSTRSQRSWSKCKTLEIITVIFTKGHLFCAKIQKMVYLIYTWLLRSSRSQPSPVKEMSQWDVLNQRPFEKLRLSYGSCQHLEPDRIARVDLSGTQWTRCTKIGMGINPNGPKNPLKKLMFFLHVFSIERLRSLKPLYVSPNIATPTCPVVS